MKALFKSQFNSGNFIAFCIVYSLILFFVWDISNSIQYKYFIIIFSTALTYMALSLWVNRFFLYEEKIEVIYFFRIRNRKKVYNYTDINLVKYIVTEGAKSPAIVFIFNGQKFKKVLSPSNSFTLYSFSKRKKILNFLKNKGISIEINSIFQRDKNILM